MPRPKGTGKGPSNVVTIRLDPDVAAHYRSRANEHGIGISEYLRQLLVQGVITENVIEIDARFKSVIAQMQSAGGARPGGDMSAEALLALYTSEELLKAIVEARDPQQLYQAQERARARLVRNGG